MKYILDFVKGIFIGLANMVPGFSGGTMAIMLNIYDKFVYAFAHLFTNFKKVIKDCWALFLGILAGFVIALFAITKLLEVIPFITIMFFVGLVLGSIPSIAKQSAKGKLRIEHIVLLLVAIAIVVIIPLFDGNHDSSVKMSVWTYVSLILVGIISSSAMVVPGISGSMILLVFGFYDVIMNAVKALLKAPFAFSSDGYWSNFSLVATFMVSCVVGVVLVSNLIEFLFKKFPKAVYYFILGLMIASPFSIIYTTLQDYDITFNALTIIFSIISCIAGIAIVILGNYFSAKKQAKALEKSETSDENRETNN